MMRRRKNVEELMNLGYTLKEIVALASKTSRWNDYVKDMKTWINEHKVSHRVGQFEFGNF